MDAIRSDYDIALVSLAVLANDPCAVGVLAHRLDLVIHLDATGIQPPGQGVDHVGTIRMIVGAAIDFSNLRHECDTQHGLTGIPNRVLVEVRLRAKALKVFAEPEPGQNAHRIRTELDSGPDLPEGRSLLKEYVIQSGLLQTERERRTTDSRTNNDDLHFFLLDLSGHEPRKR